MKWIKLYAHTRKEEFVFVIHPSETNKAANKEDGTDEKQDSSITFIDSYIIFLFISEFKLFTDLNSYSLFRIWQIDLWGGVEKFTDQPRKEGHFFVLILIEHF